MRIRVELSPRRIYVFVNIANDIGRRRKIFAIESNRWKQSNVRITVLASLIEKISRVKFKLGRF